MRIAISWKALSECPSHRELLDNLAVKHGHQILALREGTDLSESSISGVTYHPVRSFQPGHPTLEVLFPWKKKLDLFHPEILLAFHEPYCLQSTLFMEWASKGEIPLIFLSCQNIDRKLPLAFTYMEKRYLRQVQGAWFLNREAADRAHNRGFRGAKAIIPLGAAKDLFGLPIRNTDRNSPMNVGYIGRLVPEKGLEDLLQASAKITTAVHIAGGGPWRADLESLASRLGVKAIWYGHLGSEAIHELFMTMDVLVLPSRTTPTWKEQFGRVLVEAMAAGVPVIGSDSGEIPNVIGDTGLVFPEGDVSGLVDCLYQIENSPSLAVSLAQAGRKKAKENYTWEHVSDRLNGLIHETYERMG